MEKEALFPRNSRENSVFITGAAVFAAGMFALRFFLRSRLVPGALFLFCALVLCVLLTAPWFRRNTQLHIRLFGIAVNFFTATAVPAVILAFMGVFHPFWIFAGVVVLSGGAWRLAQTAHSPVEDQRVRVFDAVCECQLVIVPLFLLLYFTNVSGSSFFVWLYPVYCLSVPFILRFVRSMVPRRIIDPVMATISTLSVLAGLISEFLL